MYEIIINNMDPEKPYLYTGKAYTTLSQQMVDDLVVQITKFSSLLTIEEHLPKPRG